MCMCMYVPKIDLCVEILLEWARVRPSRNREGLGGGCLDSILTRMKCLVYMYVLTLL